MTESTGAGPAVDVDLLVELTAGDADILRDVLLAFDADFPRLMADLADAQAREDAEGIRHAGHALKGVFYNLAAHRAAEAAFELERLGKAGSAEGATDLVRSLHREADAVVRELAMLREELGPTE